MIKYCTRCLMPDTKPMYSADANGVCSACRAHEQKDAAENSIDWEARKRTFDRIVDQARSRKAPFYDALVPVSGGKDSLSQIHRLLEYDLRILAVNVDYGIKTDIGRRNLDLVPEMGANLMIYRPEMSLHKRLIRIGFEEYGDPDLLSHTLLHALPLRIALAHDIPLVLLGENSAFEYGGDKELANLDRMTRAWFSRFAANQGRDARYVSEKYDIPMDRLMMYDFPDELETLDTVRTAFSSHYFPWDSEENLRIAKKYGFEELPHPREGTYRTYVGLDEEINRIHQYFKVLKFGYGRATDHACEDIRNGRLEREKAKELVRRHDLMPLSEHSINEFCQFVGLEQKQFLKVVESYRNESIWKKDTDGHWYIPNHLEDGHG